MRPPHLLVTVTLIVPPDARDMVLPDWELPLLPTARVVAGSWRAAEVAVGFISPPPSRRPEGRRSAPPAALPLPALTGCFSAPPGLPDDVAI